MLKHSKYNIIKNENGGNYIIYNTYSTALAILDSDLKNIYDNISSNLININDEKINFLKDNGFIIDESVDEFSRVCTEERLNRYDKSILNLTIAPTLACNMNCPYCFEENSPKIMDNNTVATLINFIESKIKTDPIKLINVTWYGGEPLLQPLIIKEISTNLIDLCNKNSIKYSAAMISNGILLDYKMAKMLKNDCNVTHVQITVDGLEKIHNERRKLKNNKNSFQIIINNIDEIKDFLKVIVRINIDRNNMNEIDSLIDFLIDDKNLGNKVNIYFSPIVSKDTSACNVNLNSCLGYEEFGLFESKMIRKLYSKSAKDSIHILYPKRVSTFCTAISTNSFVIDPEGFLYSCWDYIGIKEKSIGSIFSKLNINLNKEQCNWLLLNIPDECNECKLLPLCQGGCPSKRLSTNNKPACDPRLISLNEKLQIIYDDFINQ